MAKSAKPPVVRRRTPPPAPTPFQEGTTEPSGTGTAELGHGPAHDHAAFRQPPEPAGYFLESLQRRAEQPGHRRQKIQDPTPARAPLSATTYPMVIGERVSAGQNRKPPQEIIP